jgi:hypothetical protein
LFQQREKGMNPVDSMIGHNSAMSALLELKAAVAVLGLALQDARNAGRGHQESMIIVARALLRIDQLAAGNTILADAEIKAAAIVQATDLIANDQERIYARWLARGGVLEAGATLVSVPKTINEINDLDRSGLNPLEADMIGKPKFFAKAFTYGAVRQIFIREVMRAIRATLDGKEGARPLDQIRADYAGRFEAKTIEDWIASEQYKRTDQAQQIRELKQACAHYLDTVKDDEERLRNLEIVYKDELAHIRAIAAQKRAEAEAKKNAAVTAEQRRTITETFRRATETGISQDITDEDF